MSAPPSWFQEPNHVSLTWAFSFIAAYYSCTSPATPALMLWVSDCLVRHMKVFILIALTPFGRSSKNFTCSNLLFVLPGDHPRHTDESFPFPGGDSSDVILLCKLWNPLGKIWIFVVVFFFFTNSTLNHKDHNPFPHVTSGSRWFTIKLVSGMKDTSRRVFSQLKETVVQGGDSKRCFLQLGIWCWSSYSAGHQVHTHTHILP